MSILNLAGERFSRLLVKEFSHTNKGTAYWKCVCDCGKEVIVSRQCLRTGDTKSCGCYHKDFMKELAHRVHESNKKTNNIKISDNGEFAEIELFNSDKKVFVDIDVIPKIKDICWHITKQGYIRGNKKNNGKTYGVRLHREILGNIPEGLEVDHINQNKLDNRKCNLRIVSQLENINNNYKTKCKSNTGLKYIYFDKNKNKFTVKYTRFRKLYVVGTFNDIKTAKEKLTESLIKNNFKEMIG